MKHILLPTDFSDNSKNAITYALDFFKGQASTFTFLNVQKSSEFILDDVMSAPPGTSVYQGILKDNMKQLQEFILPFQQQYEKEEYEFHPLVDFDVLTDSIEQTVKLEHVDLIIMGTNGATGAKETIFGSNTLAVIRKLATPLLAIPENYRFEKLNSLLFTTHNHNDFSHSRITPLKEIIGFKHPQLKVLEIMDDAAIQENDSCISELFKGIPFETFQLKEVPVPIAIEVFTQLFPVDMHALFVEKQTFLNRFVFGSDVAKISYGTQIPLLILHKE